jgi:hypothetical protein
VPVQKWVDDHVKTAKKKEVPLSWTVVWYSSADYVDALAYKDLTLGSCSFPEMAAEMAVQKWVDDGVIEIDDYDGLVYVVVVDQKENRVKIEVRGEQTWQFSPRRLNG